MRSASLQQNDRSPETLLLEAETIWQKEPSRAIELAEQAETLLDDSPNEPLLLRSLFVQAQSWYRVGSWDEAYESYTAALQWARHLDSTKSQGDCLHGLGLVAMCRREIPSALEWLFQALESRLACGDLRGEGLTRSAIGSAYGAVGRYREASEAVTAALQISRGCGDVHGELNALGNAAMLLEASDDLLLARTRYAEVLELAQKLEIPAYVSQTHAALCRILGRLGELDDALSHGQEALRQAELLGRLQQRVVARQALGEIHRERGEIDRAEERFHEALTLAQGERLPQAWTNCLHELGRIALLRRETALARQYFEAALQQAIDEGSVADQATQHRALADLCESEGDLPNAIKHLRALVQAEDIVQRQSARAEFLASMARLEWEKSQSEG
jgi:tetratricopeptide (TPR) repeat protein